MRGLRWVPAGMLCLLVASACSVPAPADSPALVDGATPLASVVPEPSGTGAPDASPIAESDDPAEALAGRAVAGLDGAGNDVVFRIGAEGFRLPEDEFHLDIHGDRVLSARRVARGMNPRLGSGSI